jgi:hypothetical protein
VKGLDSTFCDNFAKGVPEALSNAEELRGLDEPLAIPAPALTEFLVGAFYQGGRRHSRAPEFIAELNRAS